MTETCDFCDVLDINKILEDSSQIDPILAEKLKRYYCNNPDSENDYCPHCGQAEKCAYHQMIFSGSDE